MGVHGKHQRANAAVLLQKLAFIHARVRANGLETTQYSVVPHVEYIQQSRVLAGNFMLMKKLQQSLGNPRLLRTRPPGDPLGSLLCEAISRSPPAFPSVRWAICPGSRRRPLAHGSWPPPRLDPRLPPPGANPNENLGENHGENHGEKHCEFQVNSFRHKKLQPLSHKRKTKFTCFSHKKI